MLLGAVQMTLTSVIFTFDKLVLSFSD